MAEKTDLRVNGRRVQVETDPDRPLLYVLREDLDLTGAKYGCGEGQCGACTVLLDGVATRSCITPVAAVRGREITTIEGLEKDGKLHPVQEAFVEVGAMQCGYCTCGMIMSAVALFKKNPQPDREMVAHALEGNLCRCGTYPRILTALTEAGKTRKAVKR
jgi:isoquinoline 1-oxidoreductase alpha subunit